MNSSPIRSLFADLLDGVANALLSDGASILQTKYSEYSDDPARFGREVLHEEFTADVVEMMESFRDNVMTIARSANAVGKTHGAARCIVWFFMVYGDAQVFTAAAPPISNLSRLLWGEIKAIVTRHPEVFEGIAVATGMYIGRGPLSYIVGVSIPQQGTPEVRKAKFSGKHAPHIAFVVDEGDAVPPEIYEAIESCMSGGHARLLVLFNPRGESGPLFQMEKNRRANIVVLTAFNHPNVREGIDLMPGAVTREMTVRRINEWTRPLTADELKKLDPTNNKSCFLVPDFLIGETARSLGGDFEFPSLPGGWRFVEEPAFSYMVLGLYPAISTNQLISAVWIDRAVANWKLYVAEHGEDPPTGVGGEAGLDVSEFGVDKNVFTAKFGHFITRPRIWGGVDPFDTAETAYEIYASYGCRSINVDSIGVGSGVAPTMRKLHGANARRVMVTSSATEQPKLPNDDTILGDFGNMRDQGFWTLREWLRKNPQAMLPDDPDLREELLALNYFKNLKGQIKVTSSDALREILRRSPDRASSLMLIFCDTDDSHDGATIITESYISSPGNAGLRYGMGEMIFH